MSAQLAITEVMSSAAVTAGTNVVSQKSDFWELTNFGTNTIALDGYKFIDNDPNRIPVTDPFTNCFIAPGESIIFAQIKSTVSNRLDFIAWWGATNLPANLQVRMYPNPGFGSDMDAVQLLDPQGRLVDRVDFGAAFQAHTFVYQPDSGEFGSFSSVGENHAFKAALTDDVGSPGYTTGPVPLTISQQPSSVVQDAGLDVEFSVRADAFPRPRYQWRYNGAAIPNASKSSLVISNVTSAKAGTYTVVLSNGITSVTSAPAALLVNTSPWPASIVIAPSDQLVFPSPSQVAVFFVKARGFPTPAFQWQSNGVNIAGATNSSLVISDAKLEWSGTVYSVRVTNLYGSTNVGALLTVTEPPLLRVTERMASPTNNPVPGHRDWFELTNFGTDAVDLRGYRLADRDSFEFAFTILNPLVIEPGESIIFVENMTPQQFIDWWGAELVPPGLKVVTYRGFGLSAEGTEIIRFWNSAETDLHSPVVAAGAYQSSPGYSLRHLEPDYVFVEESVSGTWGAFHAANGGDVGSPGYVANPRPRFLSIVRLEEQLTVRCRVVENKNYALGSKTRLSDPYWNTVGSYWSAGNLILTITFTPQNVEREYFILEELAMEDQP